MQTIAQTTIQKSIQATKVSIAPKIDGLFNDEAWQNAPLASNFIVNQPNFGKNAAQKTEVKLCTIIQLFTLLQLCMIRFL
jgi:hypothetical protein